jgi:hypothetical protein
VWHRWARLGAAPLGLAKLGAGGRLEVAPPHSKQFEHIREDPCCAFVSAVPPAAADIADDLLDLVTDLITR